MENWSISLSRQRREEFSSQNHLLIHIDDFLDSPQTIVNDARLQKFARITPQYPGVRAAIPKEAAALWLRELGPMLDQWFGAATRGWEIQAWYSLVTARPSELIPMQRFPHVDGTNPRQLAMMLYLHETDHGGTAFFRHRTTGFEDLTENTFPDYQRALHADVQKSGLPPAAYVTDGEPHFERIYTSEGGYNQAVFYRGNLLHSGVINQQADLPSDPRTGRLTINAFFRPAEDNG